MSAGRKDISNWTCPWCFARGNDSAPLYYNQKKDRYYCVRCCYTGDYSKTVETFKDYQKKYRLMTTRLELLPK